MHSQPSDPGSARWAGAGHSTDADAARAARAAVAAAVSGRQARLVVLFAAAGHDPAALVAGARAEAGDAALIGSPGQDEGVVAFALGGPGFSVATAAAERAGEELRGAGAEVARGVDAVDPLSHRALLLLVDGRVGDPQELVRGAYSVAGPGIPLVGGCAGGPSWLVQDDRVVEGAVVGAALASREPLAVGVRHGWRAAGQPLLVTDAEGTLVRGLNDAPALDAYLELVGTTDDFEQLARRRPLAAPAARGREPLVRAIAGADFEARTLALFGELPTGTLVTPMEAEAGSLLAAADAACAEALAPLRGRAPLGLLAFAADSRRAALGPDGERGERERLTAAAGGGALSVFHGCGEIARTRGLTGFHNGSLAVLAIA